MGVDMRSSTRVRRIAAGVAAVALAGGAAVAGTGVADAAPRGSVYFSAAGFNCAIAPSGNVGCDLNGSVPVQQSLGIGKASIYLPFGVRQILIDSPWLPAHPGLGIGTPFTLPGGNPSIDKVGVPSGSGATSGSKVSYAGSSCSTGFHGSFSCTGPGGHSFSYYISIATS